MGQSLKEAFQKQFSDRRQDNIQFHAASVRDADKGVQSQLLELAKKCSWYEEPPQEGRSGYKLMKRLERLQEARDRVKSRHSHAKKDSET